MTTDTIDYDRLAQDAMRGVVHAVLKRVVKDGLPGAHHFYVAFNTTFPGVNISRRLLAKFPDEMTIVLQHRFWDLLVSDDRFEVKLTFDGIPERLVVPFAAVKVFFDPSVPYGLQFEESELTQTGEGEGFQFDAGAGPNGGAKPILKPVGAGADDEDASPVRKRSPSREKRIKNGAGVSPAALPAPSDSEASDAKAGEVDDHATRDRPGITGDEALEPAVIPQADAPKPERATGLSSEGPPNGDATAPAKPDDDLTAAGTDAGQDDGVDQPESDNDDEKVVSLDAFRKRQS
ncbi:MAG: ClpXP protease specificity-enhancing factor SspB [Pseudomonadota bacterium]